MNRIYCKDSFSWNVDELYQHEYRVGDMLFDFDSFIDRGVIKLKHKIAGPAVYRGYMLSVEEYTTLYNSLSADGIFLISNPEQYANAHHISNWYRLCEDRTAYTTTHMRFPSFVKDQVKSTKFSKCITTEDVDTAIKSLTQFNRIVELPFVYRDIKSYSKEFRCFYINGKPTISVPFEIKLDSLFYTVDYGLTETGWEVIECGDGQVSDLKENNPDILQF